MEWFKKILRWVINVNGVFGLAMLLHELGVLTSIVLIFLLLTILGRVVLWVLECGRRKNYDL